ncbi:MAG: glycosyltransferase family 4 protein [Candidatus Korobacteraceae bacterium]
MNITLISQYYWPESFGAGVWTAELAEWLHTRGHNVSVITGFPNHPEGVVFPEYRGKIFETETHNGVRIVRTWLYATPRTRSLWQRVLGQASFSATLLFGIFSVPRADVVWYASPPLPGTISAWVLARLHGAALAMNISDLEPERSIALGLFTSPYLIRVLRATERFSYVHADRICVLSQGTKDWLIRAGVPAAKVSVTPNWADGERIRPLAPGDSLRQELGISPHEFVVLYSGNMGYTMRDLEGVVESARLVAGEKDVRFVLAGDGVRRKRLEELSAGLGNVTFLPIQSRERYPQLLASADICLVVLNREGTFASVPSKTYSIMAAGKPVFALCEAGNDIVRVVQEAKCGAHIMPGDSKALAETILRYRDAPWIVEEQGAHARAHFEQNYAPTVGMPIYESIFAEIGGAPLGAAVLADAE